MVAPFLQPNGFELISKMSIDEKVKGHALEVMEKGYTVVKKAIPEQFCLDTIAAFRKFERANEAIFAENRDAHGHYPRIVNMHYVLPELRALFTRNSTWLQVQDVLFGSQTALYTSLFYETGSQQRLHRDSPVFTTRPEYHYFGTTVYLESADDENGCLEVMEGGHAMQELDRENMVLHRYGSLDNIPNDNNLWAEYQDAVIAQGLALGLQVKKLYVEAGDSLIWHPQLPHGGSRIKDLQRTRFSFVMHTTPVGVPVYHEHLFFNPNKQVSEKAPWIYRELDGRMIAVIRNAISFGNEKVYPLSQLRPA